MKRAEHQLLIRELIGLLCILAAVFLVFFLGSYPFIKYLSVQRLWLGYRIIVGLDPIATKLDSQEIRDNLEDLQVGFMIVDEDFQVIYYSESFYDPGSSAINMEKHKEEYTETPAIDMGKDWLGEIFRLRAKVTGSNGDSFYVYVYKNIHHILRRIEYTKQVLFVFCLIVWGIWFVYQRLLLRRIFSFPGDIVSVTKKLAEGHYSVRVKERKTDNEWEEMGADLNELGKRLLYSDASMKNYRYFSKTQSHDEDEKLLQEKQL
ncbi:MAG: hypothetical protein IKF39_07165, partial [Oscillospiraceae bacterium]|nr:hypothetical protein [Oscillospiraceae bacterium]